MEKNLFRKYFIYITVTYIVIFIGVTGAVYFYYSSKIEKSFNSYNQAHEEQYEKLLSTLEGDFNATGNLELLDRIVDKNSLLFLELYNAKGETLYSKNDTNLSPPLFLKELDKLGKSDAYELRKTEDGYVFWFDVEEKRYNETFRLIGALLLNPQLAQEIDNTFDAAILASSLTAIILAITIFPIIFFAYQELIRRKQKILKSYVETIEALGNAIAKRDSDTNSHNFRVTWYSVKIAEHIGLTPQKMTGLIMGSFLHDIGKIGIRDSILLKPDKLDEKEFKIMKTHVAQGGDILKGIDWLNDAKKVVLQHHERIDGKGYPKALKGNEISIEAKIFAISDVFDALTSKRPYKEPVSLEQTFRMMQEESGTHFDSNILSSFLEVAPELYQKASNASLAELKNMLGVTIEQYFETEEIR